MAPSSVQDLSALWQEVEELNRRNFPKSNLKPILGGGKDNRPEIMFVFINPTYRNISAHPAWSGPRYPFIGTREVWRIFNRAGFLPSNLMKKIESFIPWPVGLAEELEEFLKEEGLYLTNLVKWTGEDSTLPDFKKIALFRPLLLREIELVEPRYIVAFGLLPFKHLTGKTIKMGDYYGEVKATGRLAAYPLQEAFSTGQVIPCYFPVGRGNPKRAVEILKLLHPLR
ncbi:MAG: uracil-DNA glycosylase family protein [Patescibacteria group bacterium]